MQLCAAENPMFRARERLTQVRVFLTVRMFLTRASDVITSRLTSKAQTTIPRPVRAALRLNEGDEIQYEIERDRVILTKARRGQEADDPFRTFDEWNSEADKKAYGRL